MAWIAAAAAIAGAAISAQSQSQAAARQKQLAVQAQQRQLAAQNQATDVAMKRVQQFDPGTRAQNQQDIQQQLTDTYNKTVDAPQITAQGVQVGTTLPAAQGTGDYTIATAKEEAKTKASLHALAGLMGRIGASSELRKGEAVGIGDTAGDIGRIQEGAGNTAGIDQLGIQSVQPDAGLAFAGAALRAYGAAGAPGLASKAPPPALTTGSFARMDRGQPNWL
jgi:hypothetical protein